MTQTKRALLNRIQCTSKMGLHSNVYFLDDVLDLFGKFVIGDKKLLEPLIIPQKVIG